MSVKPALGWLGLLLFATTAEAGGARDLLGMGAKAPAAAVAKGAPNETAVASKALPASKPALAPKAPARSKATLGSKASVASKATLGVNASARDSADLPVPPKTKAAPLAVVGASRTDALSVVETVTSPRADYEAEVYAGVALDEPIAKTRGLDRGLVTMAFEKERRPAFRVGKDRIRRVVRLAASERPPVALVRAASVTAEPRDHVDVLDTVDGVVLVDTVVEGAGLFVTSDVYVFAPRATLDQRIGALEAANPPARERLRQAL
ncbi:MAG: hypothetical protein KF894_20285, partial [Labilithrix sp.]|nr:hypothetical protein [Labilithrix sp.]